MTIAFEIHFQPKKDNSLQHFLLNLFSFYAKKYPNLHFLLLSNCEEILQDQKLSNQQFITFQHGFVGKIKSFFLRNIFFEILLKRKKVNILISDNRIKKNKNLKIKTFNWINGLSEIKRLNALSDIQQVFCTNDDLKNKIVANHSKEESFIHLSNFTIFENSKPATFEQKEKIKQDFSNGNEYFLFYADQTSKAEEYVTVIKAFSLFKKWQKSNMKLFLIIHCLVENELSKLMETYKFREDVKLIFTDDKSTKLNLLSACYGCIMSSNFSIQSKMIQAIRLTIPMIIDESDFNKSSFENASVYSKMDELQLSQKMILLYKDENFRNQIINETIILSDKFNWDKISTTIWETISK